MSGFPTRTVLFVSLALNLLIIGAVAGAWVAGVRPQRDAGGAAVVERMPGPRAFLSALPPETRAVMRDELTDSWAESRDARRAAIQARRDAFAAAATEPYDAARVRAAFSQLRAADQTAIGVFHDNVIDAFGRLTPAQRREALQALRSAAPAGRQGAFAPAEEGAAEGGALGPEQRQMRQERREDRRERWRERREERLRQQPQPQP